MEITKSIMCSEKCRPTWLDNRDKCTLEEVRVFGGDTGMNKDSGKRYN